MAIPTLAMLTLPTLAILTKAATAMNERSSRAHALFILTLVQSRGGVEVHQLTNRLTYYPPLTTHCLLLTTCY